jgi:ornithine cyclodeaminase
MVARELNRADTSLGILGAGIQARLQAQLHAEVLPLETIWIWGRNPGRAEACRADIERMLPSTCVRLAPTPSAVAEHATLIVTATASREPLLSLDALQPGTHISAVGSDSPRKQEIDPAILRRAAVILADSRPQCEKLGELQHAPDQWERAIEIGAYCESPAEWDRGGITVCDYTGVGVEDLYIAEYCWERLAAHKETNA